MLGLLSDQMQGSVERAHFLAVAAQTMRRILVEFARHRHRQKRGGDAVRVTIDAMEIAQDTVPISWRSATRYRRLQRSIHE